VVQHTKSNPGAHSSGQTGSKEHSGGGLRRDHAFVEKSTPSAEDLGANDDRNSTAGASSPRRPAG